MTIITHLGNSLCIEHCVCVPTVHKTDGLLWYLNLQSITLDALLHDKCPKDEISNFSLHYISVCWIKTLNNHLFYKYYIKKPAWIRACASLTIQSSLKWQTIKIITWITAKEPLFSLFRFYINRLLRNCPLGVLQYMRIGCKT